MIGYLILEAVPVAVLLAWSSAHKRRAVRDWRELRELDDWLKQIRDTGPSR